MSTGGLGTVLRLVGIGWYVAICITGGVLGGFYLDSRLNTSPVVTLLGLALGITLAVVGLYRMLMAVFATGSNSKDQRTR